MRQENYDRFVRKALMFGNLAGPDFFIIFIILALFICLGLPIWAVADAATRPDYAWSDSGQNKILWIALIAGFTIFLTPVGFVIAIVYFASIRGKVKTAQSVGATHASTGIHNRLCLKCGTPATSSGTAFCSACGAQFTS